MQVKEINALAQCLLSFSNSNRVSKFEELRNDFDYFDDVYGYLSEENAIALILKSHECNDLAWLLPQLFQFSATHTISDIVFSMLISYKPENIQQNILIALAHCNISFYQMEYICRKKICVEAFAALLEIYLHCDCFSSIDLLKLLDENSEFCSGIAWDLLLANDELDDSKKEIVLSYIKSLT